METPRPEERRLNQINELLGDNNHVIGTVDGNECAIMILEESCAIAIQLNESCKTTYIIVDQTTGRILSSMAIRPDPSSDPEKDTMWELPVTVSADFLISKLIIDEDNEGWCIDKDDKEDSLSPIRDLIRRALAKIGRS